MEPLYDDTINILRFKKAFVKTPITYSRLRIPTLIDPRIYYFKYISKSERTKVWSSLNNLLIEDINGQMQGAKTTEETPLKLNQTGPLQIKFDKWPGGQPFAVLVKDLYPILSLIAHKYFTTPAITVHCEFIKSPKITITVPAVI